MGYCIFMFNQFIKKSIEVSAHYFQYTKTVLLTFINKRWRKFKRVFKKPKKLLKWVFYIVILIKVRATPSNLRRFTK